MARAFNKNTLLQDKSFVSKLQQLYGTANVAEAAERYASLAVGLSGDVRFFSAPGRAELIGNHTDHNHGYVLATAIDLDIVAAVQRTEDDVIEIRSVGYPAFRVFLTDERVDSARFGTSEAIVKGIIKGFRDRGLAVGGFCAQTQNNIFKGAGVSSSAAFELVICEILNALYNDGKIPFDTLAIISQFAENVYFGKPSGLMDQLTVAHGGVSFMDFYDPSAPICEGIPADFSSLGLVIVNCGGDHCNLTGEYAAIRNEMNAIATHFGKSTLRDVDYTVFQSALTELKQTFSGRAILRAFHYFTENERVLMALHALSEQNMPEFLRLITESGRSSMSWLQNLFPSGDIGQPIPLALALAETNSQSLAWRVHGGGFAGTVLVFVKKENLASFASYMKSFFGEDNVFGVSVRSAGAVEIRLDSSCQPSAE